MEDPVVTAVEQLDAAITATDQLRRSFLESLYDVADTKTQPANRPQPVGAGSSGDHGAGPGAGIS